VLGLVLTSLLLSAVQTDVAPRRIDVKSIEWQLPDGNIVLGDTTSVTLRITARRSDGTPMDLAPPSLWASTGTLGPPARLEAGVWETLYTPPPERFPHVAIVSAGIETEDGPTVGFAAMPLWGKGRLQVKTKPESKVIVYLGNESFGPAIADDRGVARVDVIAPPGPERAVAESVDAAGNQSSKPVPLGVPPFSRLALMPVDRVASADGSGEAQLLLFIVDKKGAPLDDASAVTTTTSVGTFPGAPQGLAPGLFRLRLKPGMTSRKEAVVEVSLEGSDGSKVKAPIRLIAGGPVRAEVAVDRDVVTADEGREVVVTIAPFDTAGNPSPHEFIRYSANLGRIDGVEIVDESVQKLRWVLPERIDGSPAALTVKSSTGEVLGTASVELRPGRLARIALDPVDSVVADGEGSVLLVARGYDAAGNPVQPVGLEFSGAEGQFVGRAEEEKTQTVSARFVPRARVREALSDVVARAGELEARQQIRIVPPPRAILSAGFSLRSDWNYGRLISGGPDLSLLVRIPGLLDESLHVGANIALLPSIPGTVTAGTKELHRFSVAMPTTLELAWRPLVLPGLSLHIGGGLGITAGDLTLSTNQAGVPQRDVFLGVGGQVAVGVAYRLFFGEIEAMARAGYMQPVSTRFVGTPLGVGIQVGYRFGI